MAKTDEHFTPPDVYEAVKDWACARYGIGPDKIVRPFWPGGDYENYDYPPDAVVLDNPPFSIITKICRFYLERGIPFFFSSRRGLNWSTWPQRRRSAGS